MGSRIVVNNGPGNGLLPDGTKPLPEPSVRHSSEGSFTGNAQDIDP